MLATSIFDAERNKAVDNTQADVIITDAEKEILILFFEFFSNIKILKAN